MEHIYYEYDAGPNDVIEVTLDRQARIFLFDTHNYHKYRRGRQCHYEDGGLAKKSPILLSPPRQGHWYVAIDLGGVGGYIRHFSRLLKNVA